MDWHVLLFVIRWAIIALVYAVLLVLLAGVYREAAARVGRQMVQGGVIYGRLKVIHPGADPRLAAGTLLNLRSENRLGAEPDNDIALNDTFVSGYHAQLHWDGAVWWLEDLNSKNGTLVNRQPWPPGRLQPLPPSAVLTVGDVVLEVIP